MDIKTTGQIETEEIEGGVVWNWHGGPYLEITDELLRCSISEIHYADDKTIIAGPYTLRIIKKDFARDTIIVAKDRYHYYLGKLIINLSDTGKLTQSCVIQLLSIWGLASYTPGAWPRWSDIYAIAWIKELWRKKS